MALGLLKAGQSRDLALQGLRGHGFHLREVQLTQSTQWGNCLC